MPAAWLPDPATPLHNASESSPINLTITYDPGVAENPTAPLPINYSAVWLSSPVPLFVTFTGSASGLVIAGPNLVGMAGAGIDYRKDNVLHHITSWEDLPPDDLQIFKLTPPSNNTVTAQFKAFAHFASGPAQEAIFTVQATINYTSGRDRLVAEINLRR